MELERLCKQMAQGLPVYLARLDYDNGVLVIEELEVIHLTPIHASVRYYNDSNDKPKYCSYKVLHPSPEECVKDFEANLHNIIRENIRVQNTRDNLHTVY